MLPNYNSEKYSITNSAKQYLIRTMNNHGKSNVMLSVDSGGCNGFQYNWEFTDDINDDDEIVCLGHTERQSKRIDLNLIVDKMSEMFLIGSEIDYVSDIGGSALKINNPLAKSMCGCGTSFSA